MAERTGYFSVTYGKSNLTPLSSKLDWRRLVSVPLGNGQGLQRPQDHAPAVVSWSWPSAETIIDGVTKEQRAMICAAVNATDYKASPKAKNWVGQAVAYAVGLDIEDEASRKRAASIAKALLKEGVLVEREGRDPVRRETAMFVRAA
ncbi:MULTISPECIES: hypothetical protein [Rhizobium]|uniref:ATPase n=1 Tax=Rhizobium tropici TaxID=398 RepID=A0ABR6R118_RHITR|nr:MULTISPECIES: hypothetical protein [Rhizobium]AGB71061.1 hypothetical protein RTCIAT899_CH08355 [Rhizobium tropici CIAT 899]MBB4242349.1 hypothetical protein [Rhizobium tropici]MBB5593992.1 hypothetical protein [Rhizobium tropici]MBB6492887.1 hypothetical protein [Rhizobium tropici]